MKFTWKKAAALAAMAALTVSFVGCGGGDKKAEKKAQNSVDVQKEKFEKLVQAQLEEQEKKAQ